MHVIKAPTVVMATPVAAASVSIYSISSSGGGSRTAF